MNPRNILTAIWKWDLCNLFADLLSISEIIAPELKKIQKEWRSSYETNLWIFIKPTINKYQDTAVVNVHFLGRS